MQRPSAPSWSWARTLHTFLSSIESAKGRTFVQDVGERAWAPSPQRRSPMRKPILLPAFSNRRLALLGLTVLMTVLALLSIPTHPAFASGCLPYCNDWTPTGDCCYASGHAYGREHRQCTDGVGTDCDEYRCSTGPCAVQASREPLKLPRLCSSGSPEPP